MSWVTFIYDTRSDVKNWLRILSNRTQPAYALSKTNVLSFIPHELKKQLEYGEISGETITSFLESEAEKNNQYRDVLRKLEIAWAIIEDPFFQKLSSVTNKPIYTNTFSAHLTTASLCPFDVNYNWFMVNALHSTEKQMVSVAHELFHLQFLHYYDNDLSKTLNSSQIFLLNESLTSLLNEDPFAVLFSKKDQGYEKHNALRESLVSEWRKNRDFQGLVSYATKLFDNQKSP